VKLEYNGTTWLRRQLAVKAITRSSCVEIPVVSEGLVAVLLIYHDSSLCIAASSHCINATWILIVATSLSNAGAISGSTCLVASFVQIVLPAHSCVVWLSLGDVNYVNVPSNCAQCSTLRSSPFVSFTDVRAFQSPCYETNRLNATVRRRRSCINLTGGTPISVPTLQWSSPLPEKGRQHSVALNATTPLLWSLYPVLMHHSRGKRDEQPQFTLS